MAVANSGNDNVSVLRNISTSGTISMVAPVNFSVQGSPFALTIGDINGDGKPDLVVVNSDSNSVSALPNVSTSGTIAFAPVLNFATGLNPHGVSIADIDGDGRPDLSVASDGSNTLSVLLQLLPPQGSLTANGPFCGSGTGALTFTATTGTAPFKVVYFDSTHLQIDSATGVASATAFNVANNPVTATTSYQILSVTDANNAKRSSGFTADSAIIIINALPTVSISPPSATICAGQSQLLTASGTGDSTFHWSTGANGALDVVVPPVTTTFTVTATAANLYTAAASAIVTVNPLPNTTPTNNGPICAGSTLTLSANASGAVAYSWAGPNGFTSTLQNPAISSAPYADSGTYNITVTSASGCVAAAYTNAIINALPVAGISGQPTGCASVSLTATGGSSYLWSAGNTPNSATNTFTSSGAYTVVVTSSQGCTASLGQLVTVDTVPIVNAVTNQTLCTGFNTTGINFSGNLGNTFYNWVNNTPSIGLGASGTGSIGSFTAVNTGSSPVVATITATPLSPGYAYVANRGSNNVTVINRATHAVVNTIAVGSSPNNVAISSDGSRVYVSNSGSGPVSVINTASNTVIATESVGSGPQGIAVSPDSHTIYVTNYNSGTVSVIHTPDFSSYGVTGTITVGTAPQDIVVSPDGSTLYVSNYNTSSISVISTAGNVVDTTVTDVNITNPKEIAISPDGAHLYVNNYNGNNYLSIINTANYQVNSYAANIGGGPQGIAVSPDGSRLYVAKGGDRDVVILNSSNGSTLFDLTTGDNPVGLALSPDGNELYVTDITDNNVSVINTAAASPFVMDTFSVGSQPYSYGNFVTGGLCAGVPISFTITVNPNPSVAVSPASSAVCSGQSQALIAIGGSSYHWSNGTNSAVDIVAPTVTTTYTVTVTDANGCMGTGSANVIVFPLPTGTASNNGPVCSGSTLNLTSSLEAAYSWSGPNGFHSTLQNPSLVTNDSSGGLYTVVITNTAGCTAIDSTIAVVNPLPVAAATNSGPFCAGTMNLYLFSTNPAVSYSWSGPNGFTESPYPTASVTNAGLSDTGVYTVTVTDGNGCTASASTDVSLYALPTPGITGTTTGCASVSLTATGGITYAWSGGNSPNTAVNTFTGSGVYTVTITNSNGCTASSGTAVTVFPLPTGTASNNGPVCSGSTLNLTSSLEAAYSWSGPNGFISALQNPSLVTNDSSGGLYTVVITNTVGCTAIDSTIAVVNPLPIATATNSGPFCSDAYYNLYLFSGGGGFGALWSGPNGFTSSSGTASVHPADITAAGTYTVTVTDANGCTASANTDVVIYALPTITFSSTFNILCTGGSNGAIDVSVSGGASPYYYNWSNTDTTQNLNNLIAGTYQLTVTDANGCSSSSADVVSQPAPLNVNLSSTDVSCNGASNGSITTSVLGGTPVYTYQWNNTAFTQNLTNLSPGVYVLTVTDANDCTASSSAIVTQPTAISLNLTATNALCNGQANGAINDSVSGGTPGYTYNWSTGDQTQNITNQGAGTYYLTVTDANSCSATDSAVITEPQPFNISFSSIPAGCSSDSSGSITTTISGQTPPYSFAWSSYGWSTSDTTQNLTGLAAGNYYLTVIDANGCYTTVGAAVNQLPSLSATVSSSPVSCNGGSDGSIIISNVTGGSGAYQYMVHYYYNYSGPDVWLSSDTFTNLSSRTDYEAFVRDSANPSCVLQIGPWDTVGQPAPLTATVSITPSNCDSSNGTITITSPTGGSGLYEVHGTLLLQLLWARCMAGIKRFHRPCRQR